MTAPLAAALVTVSAPLAYSFWASIMRSAESGGLAVELGIARCSRKDLGAIVVVVGGPGSLGEDRACLEAKDTLKKVYKEKLPGKDFGIYKR